MNNTNVSQTEDKANKEKADKRREYQRNYRKKNADKIRERAAIYRKENAVQIAERRNVKYTCVCGSTSMIRHKKAHEQTKKHLAFIKK